MKCFKSVILIAIPLLMLASGPASASYLVTQTPLVATDIPKYQDPLPEPKKLSGKRLRIDMSEFKTQILPKGYHKTSVYGYGKSYPGPTIEAERHKPTTVIWNNKIDFRNSVVQKLVSVDQTLHWADPLDLGCHMNPLSDPMCFKPYRGPVPAVAHLHGGEVPSAYDGGPDAWYTKRNRGYGVLRGPGFVTKTFAYPNTQEAATLWYHDHALGATRLNVFSGMSGFYLLRDWENEPTNLPGGPDDCRRGRGHDNDNDRYSHFGGHDDDDDGHKGKRKRKQKHGDCPYEREIVIQDRLFDDKAQLIFPDIGNNPEIHPFWRPAFQGNVIVVNGKSWPYMEVEPRRYRLRLLNGSNSRGYRLIIKTVEDVSQVIPVWQIGTDGGLLDKPIKIVNPPDRSGLTLGPGERADVIVDFAGLQPGQTLRVLNILPGFDPETTGQVMEFRVKHLTAKDRSFDPSRPGARLRYNKDEIPPLDPVITGRPADNTRMLTLNGVPAAGGPQALLLNNSTWLGLDKNEQPIPGSERISGATDPRLPYTTELPQVGSTEIWRFVNITDGGHPIHLHLAQFQVLDRTPFDPACYRKVYFSAFPSGAFEPFNGPPLDYNTPNSNGEIGGNPAVPIGDDFTVIDPEINCIKGPASPPVPWEDGWKDTVRVPPNTIARIAVRWAPTDLPSMTNRHVRKCPKGDVLLDHQKALPCVPQAGSNLFAFDPSAGLNVKDDGFGYPGGPGYVWHCHILDHEDNEMMRALFVKNEHDHKRNHKHSQKHSHKHKH